jgi:isocitrate/isopropylmalate dehydrogenase
MPTFDPSHPSNERLICLSFERIQSEYAALEIFNTELFRCLYVKKEKEIKDALGGRLAIAERWISEKASRRIGRIALESALKRQAVSLQVRSCSCSRFAWLAETHRSK